MRVSSNFINVNKLADFHENLHNENSMEKLFATNNLSFRQKLAVSFLSFEKNSLCFSFSFLLLYLQAAIYSELEVG